MSPPQQHPLGLGWRRFAPNISVVRGLARVPRRRRGPISACRALISAATGPLRRCLRTDPRRCRVSTPSTPADGREYTPRRNGGEYTAA